MHVLLVEDDDRLSNVLIKFLETKNFIVTRVANGDDGESKALSSDYDVIILDVVIPKKDGLKVAKSLRDHSISTPIIMLTGRSDTEDKIKGLNVGADDYLSKPFEPQELVARMRALLRRPQQSLSPLLKTHDLTLDPNKHEVVRSDRKINLMPKEYALLEYLMRNSGKVLTKNQLLRHVWGVYSNSSGNRLEVYIRYLREKVDDPFDQKLITTVRGTGYKIQGA